MRTLLFSINKTTLATFIISFSLALSPAQAAAVPEPIALNNNQQDNRILYATAFLKTFTAIASTNYCDKNSSAGRILSTLNHLAQGCYTAEVFRRNPGAAFYLTPSLIFDISSLINSIIKEFSETEILEKETLQNSKTTKEEIECNQLNQATIRLANIALPLIDLGINIMSMQADKLMELQFATACSNICRLAQMYMNTEKPDIAKRFLIGLAVNANLALQINADQETPDTPKKYTLNLLLLVIGALETYAEYEVAKKLKLAQETDKKSKEILADIALQNNVTQSNNA